MKEFEKRLALRDIAEMIIKNDPTGKDICNFVVIHQEDLNILTMLYKVSDVDKTGEWLCFLAKHLTVQGNYPDINFIEELETALIEIDGTGAWIYYFAKEIEGANIPRLEDALIEVDKTGEWICYFARYVEGANITTLTTALIEIDKKGAYLYWFIKNIPGANVQVLKDALYKVDKHNMWANASMGV